MADRAIRRAIHVIVVVLAWTPIVFSAGAQREKTISLSHLGYEKPPKHRFPIPVRAVFLDNQQIAVSFPVLNPTIRLKTREERGGGAIFSKRYLLMLHRSSPRGAYLARF